MVSVGWSAGSLDFAGGILIGNELLVCMAKSRKGQAGQVRLGGQQNLEIRVPGRGLPPLSQPSLPPRVLQGPCCISAAKQEARLSDGHSPVQTAASQGGSLPVPGALGAQASLAALGRW